MIIAQTYTLGMKKIGIGRDGKGPYGAKTPRLIDYIGKPRQRSIDELFVVRPNLVLMLF
jgi:hypothetical protein